METITRLKLSKWALIFAIIAALYCTLLLFGSIMGDPYPGMTPAEKARDTQAKDIAEMYFTGAWLLFFAAVVYMRWQKHLWKSENANVSMG